MPRGVFTSYFWLWRYVASVGLCLLGVIASSGQTDLRAETSPASQSDSPMQTGAQAAQSPGIRGARVAAWGNVPANPPTYQCLKVFDAAGTGLAATPTCSGTTGRFSVALPPRPYLVALEGRRTSVEVKSGKWVTMSPRSPPVSLP